MQVEEICKSPNITNHLFHLLKLYYQQISLTNMYKELRHVWSIFADLPGRC
jgi:hypothetical protein